MIDLHHVPLIRPFWPPSPFRKRIRPEVLSNSMRRSNFISILTAMAFVLGGCSGSALPSSALKSEQTPARALPPSLNELKNATYAGLGEGMAPVTLQNGRWAGELSLPDTASRPVVELANDFLVVGDLDGDGIDDAVTVLTYRPGGSATFLYLAAVTRKDGKLRNVGTAAIGDRVQVRSIRIDGGKLRLNSVQAGSNDPSCCPGELVESQWTLGGGTLITTGAVRTGRLSLAALAGTEWVLRAWDIADPVGVELRVTLAYGAGNFTGTSGCNRYTGGVKDGTTPGQLSVGLLAGTRMACPEPQSSVEARFLMQLGSARTFGFMMGRLMISYVKADGPVGTMLFESREPVKAP